MALNPYASIFGLDEEDDEEALALEELGPSVEDDPYAAIFSGEQPEEPVAEPTPEPAPTPREPSWMERAGMPGGSSFTGAPDFSGDVGFGEDALGRVAQGAAMVPAEMAKSTGIQAVQSRRSAAERGDVAGAMGLPAGMSQDPFTSFMATNQMSPEEEQEALKEASELDVRDVIDQPTFKAGQAIQDWAAKKFPTDPERDEEILSKALQGAGTLGAFAATSLLGPLMTATAGAGVNASTQFADAIRKGAPLDEALKTFNISAAVGVTEAAPVEFALSRLDRATGGWFKKAVTDKVKSKIATLGVEGAAGALVEAFQETFTEVANNFTASDLVGYDEERELLQGTGEAAGIGGGLGFVMNTLTAALGLRRASNRQRDIDRALVPDINKDLAEQEALDALSPDRAQIYSTPEEVELPDVSIEQDLGKMDLKGQEVSFDGNLTDTSGTELEKVQETSDALDQQIEGKTPAPLEEATAAVEQNPAGKATPRPPEARPFKGIIEEDVNTVSITDPEERGYVTGTLSSDGNTFVIRQSDVDKDSRGQGVGSELYRQLIEDQVRKGRVVESDDSVTGDAMKVWEKLRSEGYNVVINETLQSSKDDKGVVYYTSTDGRPPVLVNRSPATQVVGEQQTVEDDGIEVTELTPEELEAELGRGPADTTNVERPGFGLEEQPLIAEGTAPPIDPTRMETEVSDGYQSLIVGSGTRRSATREGIGAMADDLLEREQQMLLGEAANAPVEPLPPVIADAVEKAAADKKSQEYKTIYQAFDDGHEWAMRWAQRVGYDPFGGDFSSIPTAQLVDEFLKDPEGNAPNQVEVQFLIDDQAVTQPDVRQALDEAAEVERLSGEAPLPPAGPISDKDRQILRETVGKRLAVDDVMSALGDIADAFNIDMTNTAGVEVETTDEGLVRLKSKTGSGLTLSQADVQMARAADHWSIGKSGFMNLVRLKLDTLGPTWRNKKRSPNFRRAQTSKFAVDLAREVLLNIHGAQVGISTKLEILNAQWKQRTGKDIQSADKAELEVINAYLNGNQSLQDVARKLDLKPEIVRNLGSLRKDIDILSTTMISEGMIPNPLSFQIGQNLGSYLRVQYAMKDLAARVTNPDALINQIPEARRNEVANALLNAYLEPAARGELHKLTRGGLKRVARLYGLTSTKVLGAPTEVVDGKELGKKESEIITGTNIDLDRAKTSDIAAALSERLNTTDVLPVDVMLRFLQGGTGGARASMHGREKSAERARKLSRTDQQLKDDGYSDAEIALNRAFQHMLSEFTDPVTTIQQTVNTMLNHVASHRVVNAIGSMAPSGAVSLRTPNSETGATQRLTEAGDKWDDVIFVDPATNEQVPASEIYVRPEIRQQFDRLIRPNFSDSTLAQIYRAVQTTTKINLTALNVGSHPRNIRSSLEIAATRGYLLNANMGRTMRSLKTAMQVAGRDQAFTEKEWTEESVDGAVQYLARLGILHDSVRTGSIKELLLRMASSNDVFEAFGQDTYITMAGMTADQALKTADVPAIKKFRHRMRQSMGQAGEGARKKLLDGPLSMFRLEDEGPKIMAFMQERELVADMMNRQDLLDVMQGKARPTERQREEIRAIDRKAAKKIRNVFPTYSNVPEYIKDLSANLFITPFPSFNAEMIRNWYYDFKDMRDMAMYVARGEDAGDGYYTGMDRAKVSARLTGRALSWGAMGAYYSAQLSAIGFAMGSIYLIATGATPDDDDEVTKMARETVEKMVENGYKPPVGELDAFDPFFRALMPGWARNSQYKVVDFVPGESITVTDMGFTMPYGQITGLGINMTVAADMLMRGEFEEAGQIAETGAMSFIGDWITTEPLMQATLDMIRGRSEFQELEGWERAEAVLKVALPYSQSGKTLSRLITPDPDNPHAQTLGLFMIGERPYTMKFEKAFVDAIWPEKLKLRNASVKIRDMIRDAADGEVTEAEFRKRYVQYEEERMRAMDQISFINHSADVMGMSKSKRRKAVATSTLTGDNRIQKHELVKGEWKSTYLVPGDIYEKNAVYDSKKTREYNRWLKIMRDIQRENDWR